MRFVSLAVMFGGFKMMIERNERNTCERFVTCSDPSERNERNTPLGGVTIVRGGELVPMPLFDSGPVTVILTLALSLPKKNGGKNHG